MKKTRYSSISHSSLASASDMGSIVARALLLVVGSITVCSCSPGATPGEAAGLALIPYTEAKLEPATRAVLDDLSKQEHIPMSKMTPAQWRSRHDQYFRIVGLPAAHLAEVRDRAIPTSYGEMRVRIYTPRDRAAAPRPALVYYHGGGMVSGSLEQYDSLCQRLSARSGVILVAVDYRLAPEHKFPAQVEDAYTALQWVERNAASLGADPERLAVGGDSAGGNLAAVMAQLARDRNGPKLAYQLLLYPAVGTRGNSKSVKQFAKGYLFETEDLDFVYTQYVNRAEEIKDPRVSPILAKSFEGLPAAFVLSAEYEIMRGDIEEYARLLSAAGVPTELRRYRGTIHPFLSMAGAIPLGAQAIDDSAESLRRALLPKRS